MTVSVPLVVVLGAGVLLAYRYLGLRFWHAALALLFGFFLAATTLAPQIHEFVADVLKFLHAYK